MKPEQKSLNQVVSEVQLRNYITEEDGELSGENTRIMAEAIEEAIADGVCNEQLAKMGYRKVREVVLNIDDTSLPMSIILPNGDRMCDGDIIYLEVK